MADSQVSQKRRREKKKCARCRNHGLLVDLKGHKSYCKFANCTCNACDLLQKRQEIMRKSIAFRRHLDLAHVMGENAPTLQDHHNTQGLEQTSQKQSYMIQGPQLLQANNGSHTKHWENPYQGYNSNSRFAFQQLDLGASRYMTSLPAPRQTLYQGRPALDSNHSIMQNGYPVTSQPCFNSINNSSCIPPLSPAGLPITSGSTFGGEMSFFSPALHGSCQYDNIQLNGMQRLITQPTYTTLRPLQQESFTTSPRSFYFPRPTGSGFQVPSTYQSQFFADNQPANLRIPLDHGNKTQPRPLLLRKVSHDPISHHVLGGRRESTGSFHEDIRSNSSADSPDILSIDIESEATIVDQPN